MSLAGEQMPKSTSPNLVELQAGAAERFYPDWNDETGQTQTAAEVKATDEDEDPLNKGRKNPGRGEQWFPLWSTPCTFAEIQSLFREGRCSAGRRAASGSRWNPAHLTSMGQRGLLP